MSEFTAGPWEVVSDSTLPETIICDTMNGLVVVPANGQKLGRYSADTKLIAAAPDLLEALEMAMEIGDQCSRGFLGKFQAKARAAIAKARGEA